LHALIAEADLSFRSGVLYRDLSICFNVCRIRVIGSVLFCVLPPIVKSVGGFPFGKLLLAYFRTGTSAVGGFWFTSLPATN
jgi:hypothetical protein